MRDRRLRLRDCHRAPIGPIGRAVAQLRSDVLEREPASAGVHPPGPCAHRSSMASSAAKPAEVAAFSRARPANDPQVLARTDATFAPGVGHGDGSSRIGPEGVSARRRSRVGRRVARTAFVASDGRARSSKRCARRPAIVLEEGAHPADGRDALTTAFPSGARGPRAARAAPPSRGRRAQAPSRTRAPRRRSAR